MIPHKIIEVWLENKSATFLRNKQRVKHYWDNHDDRQKMPVILLMSDVEIDHAAMLN